LHLAECTADLEDPEKPVNRDRLKAFLEERGFTVRSNASFAVEYRQQVEADLKECLAFVQLLGPYPWKGGRFDRLQSEAAEAAGIPRFRFRSSEIDLTRLDASQRDFITAPDVMATGFEDFKSHVEKETTEA